MPLSPKALEEFRKKRESRESHRSSSIARGGKKAKPSRPGKSISKAVSKAPPIGHLTASATPASSNVMRNQLEAMKRKYVAGRSISEIDKEKESKSILPGLRRVSLARKIAIPEPTFIEEEEDILEEIEAEEEDRGETEEEEIIEEVSVEKKEEAPKKEEESISDHPGLKRVPPAMKISHLEPVLDEEEDEGIDEEEESETEVTSSHEFSLRNMLSLPFEVITSGFRSIGHAVLGLTQRSKYQEERKNEIKVFDDFRRLKGILESAPLEKRKKILNKFAEFGAVFYLIAKEHPKTIEKIAPILKDLDKMITSEME